MSAETLLGNPFVLELEYLQKETEMTFCLSMGIEAIDP